MSEQLILSDDDLLMRMISRAEKTEDVVELDGACNGVPFFVVLATGANVGLLKKMIRQGGAVLVPQVSRTDS